MAGSNNYTLGRGKVFFGQYKPNTQIPRGERYFGNTPELGYSAEQENLDHYSSDEGVRVKDESVLLQLDYAGSFMTDNVSFENLAIFFLGESLTKTVASSTIAAEGHAGVEKGLSYQLGTTAANPAGARMVSAVTVKPTTGTAYVLDEDYTVDLTLGRVTILETGAIPNQSDIVVGYTIDAHSIDQTVSKSKTIEGSMRYISSNPAGQQIDYFMPWVKITPNGDFALKGDEWQSLPFNLEILKKGTQEAIYMNGRPYTPN
jgi:hypothetical protein